MAENNAQHHTDREEYRRKRVKRMKRLIVGTVLFLLLVPTFCCIVMMFKVHKLEKQVESLVELQDKKYEEYRKEKSSF